MGVQISEDILNTANMTPKEFMIEMAVHLYNIGKLTLGQARRLAELDQVAFQLEMTSRNVTIKYDVADFMEDLQTLSRLEEE